MRKEPLGITGRKLYRLMQENDPGLVRDFEQYRDGGLPLDKALEMVDIVCLAEGRGPESSDIMRTFLHYLYAIPQNN